MSYRVLNVLSVEKPRKRSPETFYVELLFTKSHLVPRPQRLDKISGVRRRPIPPIIDGEGDDLMTAVC
jgi:hypothetical protein